VSDPYLGLTMLGLIVAAIMMGFPTAFTLMGMGMLFGFLAFWDPSVHWYNNQIFDLMVQRTYGAMLNDALISIPLFVFMGYVIERAALVDRMFRSVQLAFRKLPASLAVATLIVCAFWGMASGIVGAVVVLMGVIAFGPMLKAGYDTRLAAGAITAGGTLGILIPPSVMLIVYAAVAGQSIVKLYAAAFLPGFFLAFMYVLYIVVMALIFPERAPKLPPEFNTLPVPDWLQRLESGRAKRVMPGLIGALFAPARVKDGGVTRDGKPVTYTLIVQNVMAALVPLVLMLTVFALTWWFVTVRNAPDTTPYEAGVIEYAPLPGSDQLSSPTEDESAAEEEEPAEEEAAEEEPVEDAAPADEPAPIVEQPLSGATDEGAGILDEFYIWFWSFAAVFGLLIVYYYWKMDGEQLEILKMLTASVVRR
jgi:TRAP-type mannitol/chloroaromatic compound transport system permease large subunit